MRTRILKRKCRREPTAYPSRAASSSGRRATPHATPGGSSASIPRAQSPSVAWPAEIAIPWYYYPGSKINVLRDSGRMFLDLLTIRRNARRGVYDAKN